MCACDSGEELVPAGGLSGTSVTVAGAPATRPSYGVTVNVSPVPKLAPGVYTTLDTVGVSCSLALTVPLDPPVTLNDTASPCASWP